MNNPEIEGTKIQNNGFNSALAEELKSISEESKKPAAKVLNPEEVIPGRVDVGSEAAITPESIDEGDNFLERTLDAAKVGLKKYVEELDGGFEDTGDKLTFISGRIGLLLLKLFGMRYKISHVFQGIDGDDIGYNLQVAKFAIQRGEWGLFLN